VQGVCPAGWHLPDYDEWIELFTYLRLNSYNYNGTDQGNKYAKALASPAGWKETNKSGAMVSNDNPEYANLSGFSAFPAGSRCDHGQFTGRGEYGFWWLSSKSEFGTPEGWFISNDFGALSFGYTNNFGFPVRCIKD
jgi:uncharacterized protein (TIGR02145 family)